jgi:hypothetical protein
MTLKEKFYKEFISKPDLYPLEDCEKIADEFAIGFAEWVECYDYNGFKDTKELLEIYKKEKGL